VCEWVYGGVRVDGHFRLLKVILAYMSVPDTSLNGRVIVKKIWY